MLSDFSLPCARLILQKDVPWLRGEISISFTTWQIEVHLQSSLSYFCWLSAINVACSGYTGQDSINYRPDTWT